MYVCVFLFIYLDQQFNEKINSDAHDYKSLLESGLS